MTTYKNERSLPVYTKPFAKRRVVYATTAETKRRCIQDPCAVCKVRRAIEGDDFESDSIHADVFVFKRRYFNYSKEEDLLVTEGANKSYWSWVARELQAGLIKLK